MPANCAGESSSKLKSSKQKRHETIAGYILRHRTLSTQSSAVIAHAGGQRIFWSIMHAMLWENGIRPDIQIIQQGEQPVTTVELVTDRARRCEAVKLVFCGYS